MNRQTRLEALPSATSLARSNYAVWKAVTYLRRSQLKNITSCNDVSEKTFGTIITYLYLQLYNQEQEIIAMALGCHQNKAY